MSLFTNKIVPVPLIRPNLNISDVTLIRNCIEIARPIMLPELQNRLDVIVSELKRAEIIAYEIHR